MDRQTLLGLRDDVRALHEGGMAPSEIDRQLGLDDGTAHDVMVALWAKEKGRQGQVRQGRDAL